MKKKTTKKKNDRTVERCAIYALLAGVALCVGVIVVGLGSTLLALFPGPGLTEAQARDDFGGSVFLMGCGIVVLVSFLSDPERRQAE